jgi:hypothetical protein
MQITWKAELQSSFSAAKAALSNLCRLVAELSLATDASSTHNGGVLQQGRTGGHLDSSQRSWKQPSSATAHSIESCWPCF